MSRLVTERTHGSRRYAGLKGSGEATRAATGALGTNTGALTLTVDDPAVRAADVVGDVNNVLLLLERGLQPEYTARVRVQKPFTLTLLV